MQKQAKFILKICDFNNCYEKQLEIAKNHIYANYPGAEVVYGDTDSIFVKFVNEKDGVKLNGKEAIKSSIEQGVKAEKGVQAELKAPQHLEYEKTFWPFVLITKKRYTGIKYEFDVNKGKMTSRTYDKEEIMHLY